MEHIYVRNKEDIFLADLKELAGLDFEFLFLKYPERTIYVTDENSFGNKKVIGIITQGDFLRYSKDNSKEIYNVSFTKCDNICQAEEVEELLKSKKRMWAIPVLNEKGEVEKEYYKVINDSEEKLQLIEGIAEESKFSFYEKNVFILGRMLSQKQKKRAEEIFVKTEGRVIVKDNIEEKDIDGLKQGKTLLYVMDERLLLLREMLKKKQIEYVCIRKAIFDTIKQWREIFVLYRKVAILDVNDEFKKQAKALGTKVVELNAEKLVWNKAEECYVYNDIAYSDIEVLYTCIEFVKNRRFILVKNKPVPIVSVFVRDDNSEIVSISDEDIAYNIIPKLEENNVTCLVIDNLSEKFGSVSDKDKYVKNRPVMAFSDKVSKKVKSEQDVFWREECEENRDNLIKECREWGYYVKDGYMQVANTMGNYITYIDEERNTTCNPERYQNTLFLFGPCIVFGHYVSDEHTLGNYLRKYVREDYYIKNCGGAWQGMNYAMRRNTYKAGDIVVIFAFNREAYDLQNIKVYDIWEAYEKIPKLWDNIWDSPYHGNYVATKYVADEVGKIINQNHFEQEKLSKDENIRVCFGEIDSKPYNIPLELNEWLESAKKEKICCKGKKGSIVMNCNPFTKGHRYLIEEAKKMVDVLYIFVVEEDRSFFKFEDRLEMVRIGVEDMENVIVIPSGKYMISTATLPGYFEKETKPNLQFDATEDLKIFGQVIAKEFEITIRFAGEEPKDMFTNRYNKYMRTVLPKYNVQFFEIPRKEWNGEVISASRVRKCMQEKNYEDIRELVLPNVYVYLSKKYF